MRRLSLYSLLIAASLAAAELKPEFPRPETTLHFSKQACRQKADQPLFCLRTALTLPDLSDPTLSVVAQRLTPVFAQMVRTFDRSDSRENFQLLLESKGILPAGEWFSDTTVEIFSLLPGTVTLSLRERGYSGGAHGFDQVAFVNLDRKSGQKLSLDEILLPGKRDEFLKIAERLYRGRHGLGPKDSMQKAGWLRKDFVLGREFALTRRGILLYYNSYEIKPYAAGHTWMTVPYRAIRHLLRPQYYLSKEKK